MSRLIPERLAAALRVDDSTRLDLPLEVVRESRRRVLIAAVTGTVCYALFMLFALSRPGETTDLERRLAFVNDALGLALCGVMALVAFARPIPDRSVLALALAVEFLLCAVISILVTWGGFVRTGHLSSLTWVVPIIILFPLLVPIPPRVALSVSVACALTMPAAMLLLEAQHLVHARTSDVLSSLLTGATAAGIAVIASRTVYGAGRQVAAARRLGSYELIERVGRGGMGEVWKAKHLFLARPAAVKLIRPETLQGPREDRHALLQRFTREAQVTASLRSPHTVQLFDFGATIDGTLYYAMEFLDGMTAEHFVYRFGPLEPRRAVSWLVQACHSLVEAHGRNLVHRDIKPANLYVCRYGRDADFLKVLDFGLTKPVDPMASEGLTGSGVRLGTPGYMAPEQIYGLPADPRTDLYALGCVGYFLLAGKKPFEAEHPGELLRLHAEAPPPSLAARAPHTVPAALEQALMACLAKDPAQRPANAERLRESLVGSLDGACWTPAEAEIWWDKNLAEAG